MKFVLSVLLGLGFVFAVGLLFEGVCYLLTLSRRREIEAAADLEYEEMRSVRAELGYESSSRMPGSYRNMSEAEIRHMERLSTNMGERLRKLDGAEKFAFVIGTVVAAVVLAVYLTMG